MSSCCSNDKSEKTFPRKQPCPVNQQDYILVSLKTVLHHINNSWQANLKQQGYYFCSDPSCDIVYFGEDGRVIKTSELHTTVSVKNNKPNDPVCYCFGVTRNVAEKNPEIKNFVIQQTKLGNCSCETSNPSGRCCLKDFPS